MEYVQERVPTLHDLTGRVPDAPLSEAVLVVPMTGDEYRRDVTEALFETIASIGVERVVVPLRADPETVPSVATWLDALDADTDLLWCNSPAVEGLLADHDLDGDTGKGRDVWLGIGRATAAGDYVLVHDADIEGYRRERPARLCAPLSRGFEFSKGYYARVEDRQLYGRLLRLFYEPVLAALDEHHRADVLEYLGSFRYALAGDVGMTAEFARSVHVERSWGLEVGLLGEAYRVAGADASAQVDLGIHRHDHRPVEGDAGLSTMCRTVGGALFRVLEASGVDPDYDALPEQYRSVAARFVDQYAADAAFNDLAYDREAELNQIEAYAEAIQPPSADDRLPPWKDVPLDPQAVYETSRESIRTTPSSHGIVD